MSSLVGDGFVEDFIDIYSPLPKFSSALMKNVLSNPSRTNNAWTPYVHCSVATTMELRQPICSALNLDHQKPQEVRMKDEHEPWQVDPRVGSDYQLDNSYSDANPWDRGHLSDRGSNCWGDTHEEAFAAAESTFSFANLRLRSPASKLESTRMESPRGMGERLAGRLER
jgi:DNA/RNA endonuclease G (NUC1)